MSTPTIPPMNSPLRTVLGSGPMRLHGLDWLRAGAAILVVMLHAAIPYMAHPLPGLRWSIENVPRSGSVDVLGWWINGFIMPVFFLMNGFLAARLLAQRGTVAFVRHRLTRIGGPLLFGLMVILPLDLYAWLLGWVSQGLVPIQKMKSLKIGGELGQALHGVSHLWFLEYVLVYCLTAAVVSWGVSRIRGARRSVFRLPRMERAGSTGMLWLAGGIVLAGSVLWMQPRIVIGFRHAWGPQWENVLYYAVPFSLGWFWERHAYGHSGRRWAGQLGAASVLFLLLWPQLTAHLQQEAASATLAHVPMMFAGFGLLMSTGLFGWALANQASRVPFLIQYLSRASFWIYLVHHPVVALTQVDLNAIEASPLTKFLLATLITLTVCLLTYEGLVRTTWLGMLLNGVRENRQAPRPAQTAEPTESRRQAA